MTDTPLPYINTFNIVTVISRHIVTVIRFINRQVCCPYLNRRQKHSSNVIKQSK